MKFTSFLFSIIIFAISAGCEQEFVKDWDEEPQEMTGAMG